MEFLGGTGASGQAIFDQQRRPDLAGYGLSSHRLPTEHEGQDQDRVVLHKIRQQDREELDARRAVRRDRHAKRELTRRRGETRCRAVGNADGFDNDGISGVDDMGERETMPPYSVPLRGIQVRIRVYEPDSGSVREVTLRQNFVPE